MSEVYDNFDHENIIANIFFIVCIVYVISLIFVIMLGSQIQFHSIKHASIFSWLSGGLGYIAYCVDAKRMK